MRIYVYQILLAPIKKCTFASLSHLLKSEACFDFILVDCLFEWSLDGEPYSGPEFNYKNNF